MQYTLVITSSGRPHLLKQTWDAFHMTCDVQPSAIVVIEDGDMPMPDWFPRHRAKWISNGTRRGQIFSVDRAYDEVKTEYIFHCEDDWGFHAPGYIAESAALLDSFPTVLQVWLRGIPTPSDIRDRFVIYQCEPHPALPFTVAKYHWPGWEGGFSFNPGLRRLADYQRLGSYGKFVGYDPRGCGERQLGRIYSQLGYCAAILPKPYVYHIGDESHVDRAANPAAPRVLVAIPTADELDYTEFRAIQQQRYGRVWEHGVSGLQVNGPNERRRAVEETWWNDLKAHKNVTAKFFTGKELGCSDKFVDLPEKNKRIFQYALDNNFDQVFRCDDDTFVHVDRMLRQTYAFTGDYAGSDCGGFAIGGAGIWLSRRALEIVAAAKWEPGEWRDDAYIGAALKSHNIQMYPMPGAAGENQLLGKSITDHPISPTKMRKMYAATESPALITLRD